VSTKGFISRIYIAGPMTGYELFNFPAFDAARDELKKAGCWYPVSPADIDREAGFFPEDLRGDWDWNKIPDSAGPIGAIIKRDIDALMTCSAIYMLPGWEKSTGAKAELQLARWNRMAINWHPDAKNPNDDTPVKPKEFKDSNPKDSVGCTKPPLHCIPAHVLFEVGMGMFEGGWKYREANYRVIGVRASIYYDAAMRHLIAWWEGEDIDPASKIHHISKVMSCLAVLRDCQMQAENGSGVSYKDDRPPKSVVPMAVLETQFKAMLERLQTEHGDRKEPYTEIGQK